ncbi:hypothetical protein MMC09_005087 [Bachmanniomyces sp. S44760]|nr:hypothetical protein [Bachmanniomyces sp. S44760]
MSPSHPTSAFASTSSSSSTSTSTSNNNPKPTTTIAFFGATGGCISTTLAHALRAGYRCNALARTPSNLTTLLTTKFSISPETLTRNLRIVQGDVKDVEAVQRTLLFRTTDKEDKDKNGNENGVENGEENGEMADLIISGIGMVMKGWSFKGIDTTICATATRTILTAIARLNYNAQNETRTAEPEPEPEGKTAETKTVAKKPFFITMSTTGISHGPRDVPLLFLPLYHWLLATPHQDKRIMEDLVRRASSASSSSPASSSAPLNHSNSNNDSGPSLQNILSGSVCVRASLLTNGPVLGTARIRVGNEADPAVGYTISREDVGGWIFGELVEGKRGRGEGMGRGRGEMVSITY